MNEVTLARERYQAIVADAADFVAMHDDQRQLLLDDAAIATKIVWGQFSLDGVDCPAKRLINNADDVTDEDDVDPILYSFATRFDDRMRAAVWSGRIDADRIVNIIDD